MAITAYIGFGSNLGNPKDNLSQALNLLSLQPDIFVKRVSPLYRTEPLKHTKEKQPWYLNCVIEITTELTLHKLLYVLKDIEVALGRKKTKKWQPRIADLDILFFGNVIFRDEELCVPHQEIVSRNFVLKPLCDLAPQLIHPEYQMTIKNLFACSKDTLEVNPY